MFFSHLLNVIFPLSCLHCGRDEELLCSRCRQKLTLQPQELPSIALDKILVAADYESPVIQTIIKGYKYDNLPQLASYLAPLLIQRLQLAKPLPELEIIPVPLHRQRLRQREYNQSELLARALATNYCWPVNLGLRRIRPTRAQARLNRQQRLKNLHQAFVYQGAPLAGKHVLLLDDVITTGATMETAAAQLRRHKPAYIWGLALARNQSLKY